MNEKEASMNLQAFLVLSLVSLGGAAFAVPSHAAGPVMRDGVVPVQSLSLDELYLRPNADFADYRRVMIEPVQVEFHKAWMRDMNGTRGVPPQISQGDVRRIAEETASSLGSIVAEAFKARGYEIAAAPGPGVLRLSPRVTDLYINAPDVLPPGRTKSLARDAGEATLLLDARDAVTGTLLGRVIDRGTTPRVAALTRATSASNAFWFDAMFRHWAANCVEEFAAIKNRPGASSAPGDHQVATGAR